MNDFAVRVLTWFDQHGRTDLPWQQAVDPYRVWVSEIMLQQTQVSTVIPYYERFMNRFPTVTALAEAGEDTVLKHWSGLGYYARARNLHRAAQQVCEHFDGRLPRDSDGLQGLPGIGRSTAGAILSLAHDQAQPILDGNVKRVLARYFAVEGWPGKIAVQRELWQLAEQLLPSSRNAHYTQAMMDLGATVCTRSNPRCDNCPLASDCRAKALSRQGAFPGRKPKRQLPQREATLLLIRNRDAEILLERRPPSGIWGGLWSLPQFEAQKQAEQFLVNGFGVSSSFDSVTDYQLERLGDALEPIQHTFSHFRLTIRPWLIDLNQSGLTPLNTGVMEPENRLWYNLLHDFDGGFAAPVSQLLSTLRQQTT